MKLHLDETTSVSLYVVGFCGSTLTAALLWLMIELGQIQTVNAVQDERLELHDKSITKQTELLSEMRDSLIRIEQTLKDKQPKE